MADAVVSGFLDINNAGTPFDDLALKVWSGMVLGAYNKATVTEGRHITRKISSGKSAQFPMTGSASTVFASRGVEIVDSAIQVNSNEVVISIQDILTSPIFIDVLDEAKSHFDIRQEYARQQGQALAEQADLRVFMSHIAGSNATAVVTGQPDGDDLTNAAMGTDAAVLKANVYEAAEDLDEHNVPSEDRYLYVAPAQFYLLLQDGEFLDRDFGGEGSRATAVMRNAADFEVIKTNNLPRTNETGDATFPTNLQRDYTNNVAIACHRSGAGSVSLIDLMFEQEYSASRQGTLLLAKYAKGFDYLRPEASVELNNA